MRIVLMVVDTYGAPTIAASDSATYAISACPLTTVFAHETPHADPVPKGRRDAAALPTSVAAPSFPVTFLKVRSGGWSGVASGDRGVQAVASRRAASALRNRVVSSG
jgi:hypothetical protein